jgi:hypothetical protein
VKHRVIWEDFVRLMHLPLPFCVLAFATIGAALSQRVYLDRLALTYVGILLALCLGAYSLDELHERPYHTRFSDRTLGVTATLGIFSAGLVGIYLAISVSPYILILSALACFFIFAYNLELFGGKFHNAAWFGLSWGGLSTFGGYYVQATALTISSLIICGMASLLSGGILYLTHKFRPIELAKKLEGNVSATDLVNYSRHARRVGWTVVKIECYSMVLLAIGLILPKIF